MIKHLGFIWILLLNIVLSTAAIGSDWKLIHAGHLIIEQGGKLTVNKDQTILVNGQKIVGTYSGYRAGSDFPEIGTSPFKTIDLRSSYVLAGLIDGHVHLTSTSIKTNRLDRVTYSDADYAIVGAQAAKTTLMAGFTTVRDLGARGKDAVFAVRDGVNRGDIPGPRIFASGSTITPTGGHVDRSAGYKHDLHEIMTPSGVCNGADDCSRAVREQVRNTANAIKVSATGGVLSNTSAGLAQQLTDAELSAIVEAAHQLGRRVAVHAHGQGGIDAALDAGVDSIEHGTFLTQQSIEKFKRTGAFLVPTLMAGEAVSNWAKDTESGFTQAQRIKAAKVGPQMLGAAARAFKAGVKLAFGTDTGVTPHGENCREFELLVEAGLTPGQALYSSLISAPINMGIADQVGQLKPGFYADIIAVDDDPLVDPATLCDVKFVMKGGEIYRD